ncbi:MAG: hypothetical protein Q8859_11025, partial [Bacteroidota bacterium]|nr:hypothetical protein [Bacteroidota bacterium]
MNTFNNNSGSQRKEEESWHIKKLVLKFLNQLHWFILSVLTALVIAFLINHFSIPVYRISSKILIEDSENKQSTGALAGPERDLTQGFGLYAGMQNFDNQSIILKSYTQLYSTLKELKFEISYFKKKPFNTTEIYKESPFRVVYDSTHVQPIGVKFELQVLKNGKLKLTARDKKTTLYNFMSNEPVRSKVPVFVSREISPGEVVKAPEYSFSIILNNQIPPETDCKYYFTFTSLDQLVLNYQEELTVTPIQKRASLLELSLPSADPPKGKDFLNKLMEVYLKNNLNKKNEIASRTINFIEKQLSEVSDSLRIAENRKERFQT